VERVADLGWALCARAGVWLGHRLDGHLDAQVERLARAGVDDRHIPAGADEETSDLLERVLRRGEADPLERGAVARQLPAGAGADQRLQTLEAQREVRAAL